MPSSDDLGGRMKGYEVSTPAIVAPSRPIVIRIDGRAFHTYTRGLDRPFDAQLARDLDTAAAALCADVDGAQFAYLQSDECSIVIPQRSTHAGEHWFAGKTQKIASVAASLFTAHFNRARGGDIAQFDARVIALPDPGEVRAYLCWRQADARRNAVSMVAAAHFSHRQLHGVPTPQRREMLRDVGVDVERDHDPRDLLGRLVFRETYVTEHTYVDRRTGTTRTADNVTRSRWVAAAAEVFGGLPAVGPLHTDAAAAVTGAVTVATPTDGAGPDTLSGGEDRAAQTPAI